MEAAGMNIVAMVLIAFILGSLLGTGLPPAPTYIITVLVIAPAMQKIGINPWVIHFFAFFVAVWGELTPPTSVSAAVTSKIADAGFNATLFRAIQLCSVIFVLMGGVFSRPQLVIEPGVVQLGAMGLLMAGTLGIVFAWQAQFSEKKIVDILMRLILAGFALAIIFHPNLMYAISAIIPVGLFIFYWLLKKRKTAA
jgi:TRAP-type uncharacterized transport system fused permease subunit